MVLGKIIYLNQIDGGKIGQIFKLELKFAVMSLKIF